MRLSINLSMNNIFFNIYNKKTMGKLKIELNDIQNIRDLLQETYRKSI